MTVSILQTKLFIPPLHPHLVARPRLTNQIEQGIAFGSKLTLIAAPAGFGKSTAAAAWAANTALKAAWLSLDQNDNESIIFFAHLSASIQKAVPGFGQALLDLLAETPPRPVTQILSALLNEIAALKEPVGLVLDDYHLMVNPEIHQGITFLIEHQPPQFHLVIATRSDPQLPVARLRARRKLTEIRAGDLRFTKQEAEQFLNDLMQLGLDSTSIDKLEARTEGWVVGMLLAAQSLQGREQKAEFIAEFSGSQQFILEYLVEEILDQQSPELRKFLLQSSLLDQFCPALCDAVRERSDSEQMLEKVRQENIFIIPLDSQHTWFRFHHLFADLLRIYFDKEYARNARNGFYRRASEWHLEQGETGKAIQYAINAEDYQTAVHLIDQSVDQLISQGRVKTLMEWASRIPQEIIEQQPRILMHKGYITFLTGDVREAARILRTAVQSLAFEADDGKRKHLRGQLLALLATITALSRELDGAIREAHEALENLPAHDHIYRGRALRAWGVSLGFKGRMEEAIHKLEQGVQEALKENNHFLAAEIMSQIASVRKHQGSFHLAEKEYQRILSLFAEPLQSPPACLAYIGLAETALEKYDVLAAEELLETGIQLCRMGNIGYALQPAYLVRGVIRCLLGDKDGAQETIRMGENLSKRGGGSLESILGLAYFQARLHIQCGNLESAADWVSGRLLPEGWGFDDMPVLMDEFHQSMLARLYALLGQYEEVDTIVMKYLHQAQAGGRMARVRELSLFHAMALFQLGRKEEALAALEQSLQISAPEKASLLYLEMGEQIVPLLKMLEAQGRGTAFSRHLSGLFQPKTSGDQQESVPDQDDLIDKLTNREYEILKLLAEGQTNQQIADALIVSVNTVKKHTSNIYGKLGVQNRTQAILRAGELKLV